MTTNKQKLSKYAVVIPLLQSKVFEKQGIFRLKKHRHECGVFAYT